MPCGQGETTAGKTTNRPTLGDRGHRSVDCDKVRQLSVIEFTYCKRKAGQLLAEKGKSKDGGDRKSTHSGQSEPGDYKQAKQTARISDTQANDLLQPNAGQPLTAHDWSV